MPAYVVAGIEVTDPETYQRCIPGARASIEAHGGQMLAVDQNTEVLEGPAPARTIIVEFPDKATAEAWSHSSDYQSAMHLRLESTKMHQPPSGPIPQVLMILNSAHSSEEDHERAQTPSTRGRRSCRRSNSR